MGVIARAFQVVKSALGTKGHNPGQSVIAQLKTVDGTVVNREVFHSPGVIGSPPAGERVVLLELGGAPERAVVIACQNYQITVTLAQGGAMLFSTTADGKTLKGQIYVDPTGLIHVQNPTYNLMTALANLIQGLQGGTYGGSGAPGPFVDTTGKVATALTQLQGLLA